MADREKEGGGPTRRKSLLSATRPWLHHPWPRPRVRRAGVRGRAPRGQFPVWSASPPACAAGGGRRARLDCEFEEVRVGGAPARGAGRGAASEGRGRGPGAPRRGLELSRVTALSGPACVPLLGSTDRLPGATGGLCLALPEPGRGHRVGMRVSLPPSRTRVPCLLPGVT